MFQALADGEIYLLISSPGLLTEEEIRWSFTLNCSASDSEKRGEMYQKFDTYLKYNCDQS